ncbi:hypothetical protein D3C77_435810 [compost metagenome]
MHRTYQIHGIFVILDLPHEAASSLSRCFGDEEHGAGLLIPMNSVACGFPNDPNRSICHTVNQLGLAAQRALLAVNNDMNSIILHIAKLNIHRLKCGF